MSGITPILDTLLHQVLGKRVDIPVNPERPLPVSPTVSADAVQATRSDSRLHPQGQPLAAASAEAPAAGRMASAGVGAASTSPSTQTHLSAAATDIADLLARFPIASPSSIQSRVPLLPTLPINPASVADALARSVVHSGVFYESHLLRWSVGDFPTGALWREPQAWLGLSFQPLVQGKPLLLWQAWAQSALLRDTMLANMPASRSVDAGPSTPPAVLAPRQGDKLGAVQPDGRSAPDEALLKLDAVTRAGPGAEARQHQLAHQPPASLESTVRQQLELIASPALRWEGQLCAGVPMAIEWREADADDASGGNHAREADEAGEQASWHVTVALTLPSMGRVDVTLATAPSTPSASMPWRINVTPVTNEASRALDEHREALESRLRRHGVTAQVSVGRSGHE